jgi:hypothetical protein
LLLKLLHAQSLIREGGALEGFGSGFSGVEGGKEAFFGCREECKE